MIVREWGSEAVLTKCKKTSALLEEGVPLGSHVEMWLRRQEVRVKVEVKCHTCL